MNVLKAKNYDDKAENYACVWDVSKQEKWLENADCYHANLHDFNRVAAWNVKMVVIANKLVK